ncbi:MAG: AmpG family muropeptide MFS transporter, partial [Arenimonas sp.]
LVGNTLGFWMRENKIELSTIGFLSWVGLAYSLKFLWAPVVDRMSAPLFGRWLGPRRGWMLLAQVGVALALVGMAMVEPREGRMLLAGMQVDQLVVFGALALAVAFASATQDIVIDAWRIEVADSPEQQGLLTATSTLGYRGALLVTDALILIMAASVGWVVSYMAMAALMAVGVGAVLVAREPAVHRPRSLFEDRGATGPLGVSNAMVMQWIVALFVVIGVIAQVVLTFRDETPLTEQLAHTWPIFVFAPVVIWLLSRRPRGPVPEATWTRPLAAPLVQANDAVFGPFVEFFRVHGKMALLMLVAISLYRMPDFVMGPMANPFYADLGIGKETVGTVRASIGLLATVGGVAAAGLMAMRAGFTRTLLLGAILGPGSNVAFSYLAWHGGDPGVFSVVMVIDNFCSGFAGVALVGYMSSLTSVGYTATQYALLSSFYALPGKLLKGLSGWGVERLQAATGSLMDGYAWFFMVTALAWVPAFLLCLWLARQHVRHPDPAAA